MSRSKPKQIAAQPEVIVEPVKLQRMKAGPCRRNPQHTDTYIESTVGRVRRCKCRTCGCKWKQSGPEAGEELGLFTGPCPHNPAHMATRVYKSDGSKNFCVCDDCGNTWQTTEPEHDDEVPSDDLPAADDDTDVEGDEFGTDNPPAEE